MSTIYHRMLDLAVNMEASNRYKEVKPNSNFHLSHCNMELSCELNEVVGTDLYAYSLAVEIHKQYGQWYLQVDVYWHGYGNAGFQQHCIEKSYDSDMALVDDLKGTYLKMEGVFLNVVEAYHSQGKDYVPLIE